MSKVTRTISLDKNTESKIRDHQADAIKSSNHSVSFSEIVNLLISMTLNDDKKMETIDSYFGKIIERKSR
jgi:hypothetical protein